MGIEIDNSSALTLLAAFLAAISTGSSILAAFL